MIRLGRMAIRPTFFRGIAFLLAVTPTVVSAQAPAGAPTTIVQLYNAVCRVGNWFFAFALVIAVVAFVYAGLQFFTGGGNEQQISKAKQVFKYGLIGIAIAVLAKSFIFIIANLIGITDIGNFFTGACA